ncbi:S1 RNA-binding domain-containing protein [Metamycoplasma hominis]|uniref:Tex-like N-terminal domain-containing protein n=1 Tax=Metamycoplasma hominis TaxID=2098 RepID=UPI0003613E39|nr:Tex-like N-terminal domain-containing protein [Metamycoplasma hominis]AIU34302.1 transcription accessory protein Tex [Metamycoplasma hominis ATCC 27545]AYK04894.1 S1 RNA-binding domain-containing protein [Metamycoplasma hominis]KGF61333.1 RNA-binding protein S1 [Metamycoplasma hominis]OKL23133.1 RNA-binding protein [Metamycoplasma hominis]RAW47204.1 S1 RNA-binding domain-containing protein [Metamycoplasma hominis]
MNSINNVAKKLNLSENQVKNTLSLLSEGATVPFISRYRKNITGGLDEDQITKINDLYVYDVELNKRKEAILNILAENKLLNDELKQKIEAADTKQAVENIYEPFKIGKKTKASDAIALGLSPLADEILNNNDDNYNLYYAAKKYISDKLKTEDEVLQQTKFIIAQNISQDPSTREYVKNQLWDYGVIETKLKKNAIDENETFKQYYNFSERVNKIPNHRILAISRGEDKKILSYDITYNEKKIIYDLNQKYFKSKRTAKCIQECILDALDRLIIPSIIREIKTELFERAEAEAIKVFASNVEQMLLSPATKNKRILAIDPAYVNGCKIAAIDQNGNFLKEGIIYPHNHNQEQWFEAINTINKFIDEYKIDLIVIGNGTASRETESFIDKLLQKRLEKNPHEKIKFVIVSEVGASVYSASKIAQEEFPQLHVEYRSAIHIGRKFQDPLNELIKIDPKSIGIGQYQHDVNQKELSKQLTEKLNKVVNLVGVDLNTATKVILSYISGLSNTIASNIVNYREENGSFKSREELKKVKGLGPKAYEQSVGFLRIHDSNNFYDKTNIHPESYKLADTIVNKLNIDLNNIDKEKLLSVDKEQLAKELNSDKYSIQLIIESLIAPEKDIRDDKPGFLVSDKVLTIDDITQGQIIKGQIQNVTDFGAFAFIGLKQNVLIHITNMKKKENQFIKHPLDVLNVGDNVNIQIISIDKEHNKIQGKIIWD